MSPSAPLLEVSQLRKHFVVRQGLWGRARGAVRAVDGVDLNIRPGETLGPFGQPARYPLFLTERVCNLSFS